MRRFDSDSRLFSKIEALRNWFTRRLGDAEVFSDNGFAGANGNLGLIPSDNNFHGFLRVLRASA